MITTIATWIGYAVLAYVAIVVLFWSIVLIKNYGSDALLLIIVSPAILFEKIKSLINHLFFDCRVIEKTTRQ